MTNMAQTLSDVKTFLAEIPQEIHGTARIVALLQKLGITDTSELSELCAVSRRMVQMAAKGISPPAKPASPSSEGSFAETKPASPKTKPISPSEADFAPHVRERAHFVSKPSCEEGRKKEIVVDDARALAVKLLEAGGQALSPIAVSLHIMSEPIGWIESGADVDLDIVPTVRALALKAKPASIQSWRYFHIAVAKSRDARLEGLPPPQSGARSNGPTVRKPGGVGARIAQLVAEQQGVAA